MKHIVSTSMKPLTEALSRHPYGAILYGAIAGGVAVGMGLEDHWFWPGVFLQTVLFAAAMHLVGNDIRRIGVVSVLILSLVSASAQEKPEAPVQDEQSLGSPCAWRAAAAVVVMVGTYVTAKMAKFCQKHFPKPRKLPEETNDVYIAGSPFTLDSDTHAAAFNWSPLGSCMPDDPCYGEGGGESSLVGVGERGIVTVLEIALNEDPDGSSAFVSRFTTESGSEGTQTWEEFQSEVAKDYGVFLTGQCCESFFACNGAPVAEAESPIRCDASGNVRVVGGLPYRVMVDCSRDLQHWDRLLSIEAQAGYTLRVEDATRKRNVFYRWSAVPAW